MKIRKMCYSAVLTIGSATFAAGVTGCAVETHEPDMPVTVIPDTPSDPQPSKWIPDETGTFNISPEDGTIIKFENSSLLSIFADGTQLRVDSKFGNVVTAPRIIYIDEFESISDVPLPISATMRDTYAEIHAHGGYMVKLTVWNPYRGDEMVYYIRLWLKNIDSDSYGKMEFQYDIFARKL